MKSKLLAVLVCLFAGNALFANTSSFPVTCVTTGMLNVRQQPSKNGKVVGLLRKDNTVVVDSLHNDDWACITYEGKVAYVSTSYIRVKRSWLDNVIATKGFWYYFLITLLVLYLFMIPINGYIFYGINIGVYVVACFIGCAIFHDICSDLTVYAWMVVIQVVLLCVLDHNLYWIELLFSPFYGLNQMQHFLQKPWRFLERRQGSLFCRIIRIAPETNPSQHKMQRFCYTLWDVWNKFVSALLCIAQFALYLACTPLRLANAVFYNIIVHIPFAMADYIAEVFYPKGEGMRYLDKWEYLWQYIVKLPYRFWKFFIKRGFLTVLESVIYTFVDIVVPTLTMYHGTTPDASHKITGDDEVAFKVGDGNYAGNGIYFGISKNTTAEHYERGVIIVARVSMGNVLNVNATYDEIRNTVGRDGRRLTEWGLKHNVTTIEWWRGDADWWEYCMLQVSGVYKDSWRIRPLYVRNSNSGIRERIYKGMAHWLFK